MNGAASSSGEERPRGLACWAGALAAGEWRVSLACFGALAVFYLVTAAGNLGETDDVYAFAYRAENFPLDHLSDPRLMLYHVAMRLLYLGGTVLGLDVSALTLMRVVSALAAAGALLLVVRIAARDLRVTPTAALATAALLGCSYGFWRYAAEAEVYVPAIFLILLVFRGLSALREEDADRRRAGGWLAAAGWGGFAGLSVLFYQPSLIPLFFAFPLLLADGRRLVHLGCYLAGGGAMVLLGYIIGFLAYWPEPLGVTGLIGFLSQRAGEFIVPPLSLRTVLVSMVRGAFALGHDIAAANWIFAFDPIGTLVQRAFSYNVITEEVYLAKRAGLLAFVPIVTLLLLAAVGLRLLMAAWPVALAVLRDRRVLVILLWIAVNGAVIGRLNPAGLEAWIMILPPLVLIFGVVVLAPCLRRTAGRWILALVAVLFLHNAVGGMALVFDAAKEYDRVKGEWVIAEAEPRDLVIIAGNAGLAETLRYLSRAEVALITPGQVPAVAESLVAGDVSRLHTRTRGRDFDNRFLRSLIREAGKAGGRVILFNEFFERPAGTAGRLWSEPAVLAALRGKAVQVHDAGEAGATYVVPAPSR